MNFRKAAVAVVTLFLLAACGLQFSPSKDPWFAQHYFIMQDFERSAYKSLSPASKLEFQTIFWEVRAPVSKQEFNNRMAYINENFKKENSKQPWNTDRARVFLLNGNPAEIDSRQNEDWTIQNLGVQSGTQPVGLTDRGGEDVQGNYAEIWTYHYGRLFIYYTFVFSRPSSWKVVQTSMAGNRYLGEFELQNKLKTFAVVDEKLYKEKLETLKTMK